MRERLLAGEVLTNRGVQAEYGISNDHTVSDAVVKLRNDGYNVVKDQRVEKGPNGRAFSQAYWHVEPKKRVPRRKEVPSKGAPSSRTPPKNSISEQVRQRLLEGKALSSREVAEQYKVSRSLLGGLVAQMRQDGHTIETERVKGGETRFYLGTVPSTDTQPPKPAPKAKRKSRRVIYADLALRFEAGERINAHMVMSDYGVNTIRFLAGFLQTQRKKGWTFTRTSQKTEGGWRTVYRLKQVDPKKAPAWVDEPPTVDAQLVDVTDRTQGPLVPVEGSPAPLDGPPDLPPLATQVTVVLHLWDPETGVWTLGLRNGQTSWLIPVVHGS